MVEPKDFDQGNAGLTTAKTHSCSWHFGSPDIETWGNLCDGNERDPAEVPLEKDERRLSKIAFLFPGQGAQTVGMGKELYNTYEPCKALFDQANEILMASRSFHFCIFRCFFAYSLMDLVSQS